MFGCVDNSCIPQIYVCNGIQDCPCFEGELLCDGSNKESFTFFPHTYYNKILNMFPETFLVYLKDASYTHLPCKLGGSDHYIPQNKWCIYEHLLSNREPLHCPFG